MTLNFRLSNAPSAKDFYSKYWSEVHDLYWKKQKTGEIRNIRHDILVFDNENKGVLHFNSVWVFDRSPVSAFDITKAEIEARELAFELFSFLKSNFKAFENCELLMTAPHIGVRESRRIIGEYVITAEDIASCKKFDDAVVCANYPFDIHRPDTTAISNHFDKGEYYTIPYRAFIPKDSENLLAVGRCISATHEALGAIRVMPITTCMGETAGMAVAIAKKVKCNVRQIDTIALKESLKKMVRLSDKNTEYVLI